MAIGQAEFWTLVTQSGLLAPEQCQHLHQEFSSLGYAGADAAPLAEWLVSRNIFSRYQTAVLLAGRPGPFVYGDYRIYDRVEKGRLANQFRAVHSGTGHPVLLQFLAGPIVSDPQSWAAAASEARVACSLSSPYLQRMHELVDLGSFKFLASEDLHGETLDERLAVGRFPPHEAARIARSIALGLSAVHQTHRAHGDVRPTSVWLEPSAQTHPGGVKLLRDPLTPPAPPNFSEDPHGRVLAQSDYLAPEFQMPGKSPDILTDLYALGCTLYHMLAGHPPFPGGALAQKMMRHGSEAIRPLEGYGVPQPLAQLVTFLMAKNPSLRYQDAKTVAEQLAAFVDPALVHWPAPAAMPTLSAYEAAVRQSQARLSAQSAQSAFGINTNSPAATQPSATGVNITTAKSEPTLAFSNVASAASAAIPRGRAVGASAPATINVKNDSPEGALGGSPIERSSLEQKLLAAKEARERKKLITILSCVGVAAVLLIVGVNMMNGGKRTAENTGENGEVVDPANELPPVEELHGVQTQVPDNVPKRAAITTTNVNVPEKVTPKVVEETPVSIDVVDDDGKLPWASPTSGKPIDLSQVPPSGGVFIAIRGADLMSTKEGPKAIQALGPKFESVLATWEKASGFKLGELEQAIVTLHGNNNAFPRVSIVGRPKSSKTHAELLSALGDPKSEKLDKDTYYVGSGGWNYLVREDANGSFFVMSDPATIKEAITEPGTNLGRELALVRKASDDQRHVSILFYPSFLFSGDGDPLFTDERVRIKKPLEWLLGDGLKAALVSMHFSNEFYGELRGIANIDREPHVVVEELSKRFAMVPKEIKTYSRNLSPPEYCKDLILDFWEMVSAAGAQLRFGAEDRQAVVNVVLPPAAGHNLILGGELVMSAAPGAVAAVAATPAYKGPKTLDEAVKTVKLKDFSFAQDSVEFSVQNLESSVKELLQGAPFDFSIRIIGKDLELDGITRNGQVRDFKQMDKTVAEVLTAMMMKVNPITTVKEPSEADQKLIWVIGPDPDDNKTRILITTRNGAAKRNLTLPDVFQLKK